MKHLKSLTQSFIFLPSRVPWTARRSNESIFKEISPEYSLEGLSWSWNFNTLATWCEELTHWKRPWCWERLRAGGEWDDRGWYGWMASPTWWTWVWASSESWWWTGKPGVLQSMWLQSQTQLSNWTDWTDPGISISQWHPSLNCILNLCSIYYLCHSTWQNLFLLRSNFFLNNFHVDFQDTNGLNQGAY